MRLVQDLLDCRASSAASRALNVIGRRWPTSPGRPSRRRPGAAAKQIAIEADLPDHLTAVRATPSAEQVVWDLLSTPGVHRPGRTGQASRSRRGRQHRLSVQDSGQVLERNFIPFASSIPVQAGGRASASRRHAGPRSWPGHCARDRGLTAARSASRALVNRIAVLVHLLHSAPGNARGRPPPVSEPVT